MILSGAVFLRNLSEQFLNCFTLVDPWLSVVLVVPEHDHDLIFLLCEDRSEELLIPASMLSILIVSQVILTLQPSHTLRLLSFRWTVHEALKLA